MVLREERSQQRLAKKLIAAASHWEGGQDPGLRKNWVVKLTHKTEGNTLDYDDDNHNDDYSEQSFTFKCFTKLHLRNEYAWV